MLDKKYDPGFGKEIQWDIPILEGYNYEFVENKSRDPGSHHFKGIDNPGLVDLIQDWKADALLIYGWSFKSHLKMMRYFKGKIPVFFRGDSTILQGQFGFKSLLRKLFLKWVYKHIDKALYVGSRNKEYYLHFGLKSDQLIFAPHAINNHGFYEIAKAFFEETQKWRESLGIRRSDVVFLYAGKLDENKNTGLLASTFMKIRGKNIHLIITGNGLLEESLKAQYADKRNIHFLPFQNQSKMPVLYSMADVFVLPSLSETWGLGINEAMACGKAVLVSDACGAAVDLVKEGINGFTFRSGDADDLEKKMLRLLEDRNELSKMGYESLNIIRNWSYEKDCIAIEFILS